MEQPTEYHFYHAAAPWWPLISPPEDYAEEASFAATMLASASIPVREVLELGSGGGHNAVHLRAHFRMTLIDLSPDMLRMSQRLNPECKHLCGDMRSIRLRRRFDAVFVHDAVDYMTSEADLRRAMETAYVHCRPGGVVVFVPDDTAETFEATTEHGGSDGPDGRGARYLEWTWDPDPADSTTRSEYVLLLRDVDRSVRVVHETHLLGLFGRQLWLRILAEVGFEPQAMVEVTTEDRAPRELFVGHRPRADGRVASSLGV